MATIVGKDRISIKRDLKNIFPKEFANRQLIDKYITYILNHYFEKSNEKLVSAFVGEVVPSIDGTECYLKEPTLERQMNQIIPILKTSKDSEDFITYDNFINDLYAEGCPIKDQNKLLASNHWSWCPPINVDMFINYSNYYWIGSDENELPIKVFTKNINVEKEIIGKESYEYYEIDENGYKIESSVYKFKNGDKVAFTNDSSNLYNNIPYIVNVADEHGYITLKPVIMPLIILDKEINVVTDLIGNETYRYIDEVHNLDFELVNGMRLMFINDANDEYNNKPLLVDGVGKSIMLLDDSYKMTNVDAPEYITMERNSIDGNQWSNGNRWVHRSALELFNVDSIDVSTNINVKPYDTSVVYNMNDNVSYNGYEYICISNGISGLFNEENWKKVGKISITHATMPIICYLKDIELYNSGVFNRGYVLTTTSYKSSELNGISKTSLAKKINVPENALSSGQSLLLLGNKGINVTQLYTLNIPSDTGNVVLQPKMNGQKSVSESVKGDVVNILYGENAGKNFYFDGNEWVEGQVKSSNNQPIMFNLYDSNKLLLNNPVEYPNSTFKGSKLFGYTYNTAEDSYVDETIGIPLVIDDLDKNYYFTNYIESDKFYYTPINEYTKEIKGYKFFKRLGSEEYLNDWYFSNSVNNQYIKTRIDATDESLFDGQTYKVVLKYKPSETSNKKSLLITKNGNLMSYATYNIDNDSFVVNKNISSYELVDNTLYLYQTSYDDVFVISILTDDEITELADGYMYETPLSLTTNQLNNEITTIGYNKCFDQMIDIIQNQQNFVGKANGSNNYSSISTDLSVGTKIIQNSDNIIRTMVLNNNPSTSIRASIDYVANAYNKFKLKFKNILDQMHINGSIVEDDRDDYEVNVYKIDEKIKTILNKINVGKEGLMPFYNNGVIHLLDNAYIPSTPAYLGIADCFEPRIEVFDAYFTENKPSVLIGHDGSYTKTTGTIKDLILLRFETLIYNSINSSFKNKKQGINSLKFLPGKFRKNTYTRTEVLNAYSIFFNNWANTHKLDYTNNTVFTYMLEDDSWKTWNYTGMLSTDGEPLYGSYRAIYTYYYDTYRPDTHPWEMLGFGDKPTWWDETYGEAPYTANNINMWKDIENGIIRNGYNAGQYSELKRLGLVEKYIPVDEKGRLKSPMAIGIIEKAPSIQIARKRWSVGDMGEVEFAYMQTSEYRYTKERVFYLLRPIEWVETNWNTTNTTILFKGTSYEQAVNSKSLTREVLSETILHNEVINGEYVQNIGFQQWVSDYLVSDNLDITTTLADKIRNANVVLGYRCAGYYQKDTLNVITDSFGEIPQENIHLSLFKSKNDKVCTYSGIVIEKTEKGYLLDGFDLSNPCFNVFLPEINGKTSPFEVNGKTVVYHNEWKSEIKSIPYRTEFNNIQDVYDIIIGYEKYLTNVERWYFNTISPNGEIITFRSSAESFVRWATIDAGKTVGNIILLNPGALGIGNNNYGIMDSLNKKICGQSSVLNIYQKPISMDDLSVYRQTNDTFIISKNDEQMAMVKFRTYDLEHLLTLDNKTVYNDVLYDPTYSTILSRMNISGVKVRNWSGDMYSPGYVLTNDGAIPNFDKKANDLQYMFDIDDVHCQGDYAKYSKSIVGYNETKTYRDLFKNNKSMFDFYKGVISQKGTASVLNKLNRSSYISSTGNNVEIYENWAFKAGEFGHITDNSIVELLLDTSKMEQNPQLITFETSTNYYYNETITYKYGDIVIYNNNEYECIDNDVIGSFDATKWKLKRFVGDYIVFWEDERWLKKPLNKTVSCFKYVNDFTTNPIGGFAMIDDCEYIVANEEEFDAIKDEIKAGEYVWVVKKSDGDWDMFKKTGENKFVSMRYNTLEDAKNQPEYKHIYHFVDNNQDYYTYQNSSVIDSLDPIYSDIDCNNEVLKWKDITIPTFTGHTSEYIKDTQYKIKLYNSLFLTRIPEDNINSNSPILEYDRNALDDSSMKSKLYSDLLLTQTQFGTKEMLYKYNFTISVDTKVDEDVIIKINGYEYKCKSKTIVVSGGSTIEWEVSAYGCGSRSGKIEVKNDGSPQPLNIIVPLSYRNNTKIFESSNVINEKELPLMYEGTYEIKLVGAGGGAGGGSTKKKHKHGGNGGAGGAYLHGSLKIENTDTTSNTIKYFLSNGEGGEGGNAGDPRGHHGHRGGDAIFCKKDNGNIKGRLIAQGGMGGRGARRDSIDSSFYDEDGRRRDEGGKYICENFDGVFTINGDSSYGNNGGLKSNYESSPAKSVYPLGNYGEGGAWVYKGKGKPGIGGYVSVVYTGGQMNYDSESMKIKTSNCIPFSVSLDTSDSLEYTSFYQPYIVPYGDDGIQYFYSYDVLYDDGIRPNASIVNNSSKFYRNRSKMVQAYHKTHVMKNVWVSTSKIPYKVGDLVSYEYETGKYTYYECIEDHISNGKFDQAQWIEHKPTYYYKITYNGNTNASKVTPNGNDYKLYYDEDCLNPVCEDTTDEKEYHMTTSDLNYSREYYVGDKYTLVDLIGTYSLLRPTYIKEPTFYSINAIGTFEIVSGGITYYVQYNEETMNENNTLSVYNNSSCTDIVKIIRTKSTIVEEYEEYDMQFMDLINTEYKNIEISYQLKDGDIELYTSKKNGILDENDVVYSDERLTETAGVYGDYIPHWERITYKPVENENKIISVAYKPIENTTYLTPIVKKSKDSSDVIQVYYESNGKYYLFNPSFVTTDEKIVKDSALKLYEFKDNKFTAITTDLYVGSDSSSSTYYTKDKLFNDTQMYYNDQCVGKNILLSELVDTSSDELESLNIMFTKLDDDPLYQAVAIVNGGRNIQDVINDYNTSTSYLNKEELEQAVLVADRSYNNKHICKVCHLFRNVNDEQQYIKGYLYGKNIYVEKLVYDEYNNTIIRQGINIGTYESLINYTENSKATERENVDKIVNTIMYKENGDYFYISYDSFTTRNNKGKILSDSKNISVLDGTIPVELNKGWMKVEFINKEYMFDTVALERRRLSNKHIESCYLVDDDTDKTIIEVQPFDPIQNVLPNNVTTEINYISSIDPVNDYNDYGKWNDQKIGYLWWDTSKVRYVDYYQGDYTYRRTYWGKQLPGSEIAIMEWTKSIEKPTDGRKYITKVSYNYQTESNEVYYYYWEKNPIDIPNVSFRKNSALNISSVINNPTDEGIVWVACVDGNIYGKNENTLLLTNYNNVMKGQSTVLQININSDVDINEHKEWVLVKENTHSDIPNFLWEKMKESLLGVKVVKHLETKENVELSVPSLNLKGRQRLGISNRPIQSMFSNIYRARENFIDIVNTIFKSRDAENINTDIRSPLVDIIHQPKDGSYQDIASTKLEMMSWRDIGLVNQHILVRNDETLDGIWAIYRIDSLSNGEKGYVLVDYQHHNISKYLTYIDWYLNDEVKYIVPTHTVTTSAEAQRLVKTLSEDMIVKYQTSNDWGLWQLRKNEDILEPTLVGKSSTLLQINESIYDYVNDGLDNTTPYITTYKNVNDEMVVDKEITKYQYIYEETQYLLEKIIKYFEN
jgi:hypothetical protein